MNRHGGAAIDFETVSGSDKLVVGPTHTRGGKFDLLITDFLTKYRLLLVVPIGNSDHSSLLVVISMVQAVLNLDVSRKVYLKLQVI